MSQNNRTSFYQEQELKKIGFKSFGRNVKISRFARFYEADKISLGNNVRIDDFCILSGNIVIGSNIHISAFCALYGGGVIILEDFTGLSPRCTLFSASDDFSGNFLIGPIHPEKFINVVKKKITISRYAQLGANTTVLPGVNIGEGAVTGAMTLVIKNIKPWGIYKGIPATFYKKRSHSLLKFVEKYYDQNPIKYCDNNI